MKFTDDQIARFTELLGVTRERELNCNECLDYVAEFVEFQIKGLPIPDALEAVEHHLSICPECHEEYELLKNALSDLDANHDKW